MVFVDRGKRAIPLIVLMAVIMATILCWQASNLFLGRDPKGNIGLDDYLCHCRFHWRPCCVMKFIGDKLVFKLKKTSEFGISFDWIGDDLFIWC